MIIKIKNIIIDREYYTWLKLTPDNYFLNKYYNLDIPIELSRDFKIVNGYHRLIKAELLKHKTIKAKIIK